jgi:hypothetical protein
MQYIIGDRWILELEISGGRIYKNEKGGSEKPPFLVHYQVR